LEKAIRSHCEQLKITHLELQFDLHLEPDRQSIPERMRLALFRVYQVALTNVVRHAQASRVVIRLMLDTETVILEIEDDGCGFEVPERWIELARQGHLGLVGATERAEAVGGKMEVKSKPGKGTLIRVVVPHQSNG
jgi:signal transduction histidine kinase